MKLKNLSILVLLAALAFSFAACGGDNDDEESVIIGTWQYSGTASDYSVDVTTNNDSISGAMQKYIIAEDVDTDAYTIEFRSDGTYTRTENGTPVESGTYIYNYNYLTLVNSDYPKGVSIKTAMNNDKLSWVDNVKSNYVKADGSIDYDSTDLEDVFTNYAADLGTLTKQDLKSVSKAQITYSHTRVIIN